MYFPVLRAKMGELQALQNLSPECSKKISPILQIIPDSFVEKPEGLKDPLDTLITRINKLDKMNLVLLDNFFIPEELYKFEKLVNKVKSNVNISPVLHPNSTQEYYQFVLNNFPNKVFIRVKRDFMSERILNSFIGDVISDFGIDESKISIIFDLGYVLHSQIDFYENSIMSLYKNLTNSDKFETIICSAGSFPKDVTDFKVDTINEIPRVEKEIFDSLKSEISNLNYSDYSNVNPNFDPFANVFSGSCTLKYTSDDNFVIFRGRRADMHPRGNEQYNLKCEELVELDIYPGKDYCFGDSYIDQCANGESGPGNATTWAKVTQNHHFTKVVNQLNGD
jgi:hypothetical protein